MTKWWTTASRLRLLGAVFMNFFYRFWLKFLQKARLLGTVFRIFYRLRLRLWFRLPLNRFNGFGSCSCFLFFLTILAPSKKARLHGFRLRLPNTDEKSPYVLFFFYVFNNIVIERWHIVIHPQNFFVFFFHDIDLSNNQMLCYNQTVSSCTTS